MFSLGRVLRVLLFSASVKLLNLFRFLVEASVVLVEIQNVVSFRGRLWVEQRPLVDSVTFQLGMLLRLMAS